MIISHKYEFIFIKTWKTAGTSIEAFLSRVCGEEDILTPINPIEGGHRARNYRGLFNPFPEILAHNRRGIRTTMTEFLKREPYHNHIAANIVKERIGTRIWNSYFTFCFERNPWDRTLSHFFMLRHKRDGDLTLDQYLEEGKICVNYPLYTDGVDLDAVIVDHVAKYESIDDELTRIFGKLGIPYSGRLTDDAKAGYRVDRRPYRDVYDLRQREIVARLFKKEIQLHGYEF